MGKRYTHSLNQVEAHKRVDNFLSEVQENNSKRVSNISTSWNGAKNRMDFAMEIKKGKKRGQITGHIILTKGSVTLHERQSRAPRALSGTIIKSIEIELKKALKQSKSKNAK